MTIGKLLLEGYFNKEQKSIVEILDAISMLCIYGIIQRRGEYDCMFPQELMEENFEQRVLEDMVHFQYFRQKNIKSKEAVLKHLCRKRIHYSIWRNREWLWHQMPGAYIKGGSLYYQEEENGVVVDKKSGLYSYKMLFAKPKTNIDCWTKKGHNTNNLEP